MPQTVYYVQLDDDFFGPFALETVMGTHLTPDVLVLSSDTNEWRPAGEYPELADSLDLSLNESETEDAPIHEPAEDISGATPSFDAHTTFYIRRGGSPYGPYTLQALSGTGITEETHVSVDGMSTWVYARQIPGLLSTIAAMRSRADETREPEETTETAAETNMPPLARITQLLNEIHAVGAEGECRYKRVFASKGEERDFLMEEYSEKFDRLLALVRQTEEICSGGALSSRATFLITETANKSGEALNSRYASMLEADEGVDAGALPVGRTAYSFESPLAGITLERMDFLELPGGKNLCVTYTKDGMPQAMAFVNTVIGRLYEYNPARSVIAEVIDTEYFTGLDDVFKLLKRDLYRIHCRPEEIRNLLASLQKRAGTIMRNLLTEKGATLRSYNRSHEGSEPYIVLVVKNFPKGLSSDNLEMLGRLAKVGPQTGIYLVLLADSAALSELSGRDAEAFDMQEYIGAAAHFDFKAESDYMSSLLGQETGGQGGPASLTRYDSLDDDRLRQVVASVNAKCELREDVVVSIGDYMPPEDKWWKGDSARQIEIPFGVNTDLEVKSLKITQESGQNTAIVIGIPGSGKSVFLHSLICSAALRYSPDELGMYLIDFSGVEFNSYAVGCLPHARVIAPEAEREFGLSILNELVEEGARRMELCRNYNVSNIVDLKNAAPGVKVPRILVIIDEFQKLFEIENDQISREANSKIHTIIQEFRKFGINLVLATQKLPSGAFLPRDLIANRVVFKSSPADFSSLISLDAGEGMPRLRTGQCVYNSESGAPYDNNIVQGFFVSKKDIDEILARLGEFAKSHAYTPVQMKVFRSAEQPEFIRRRVQPGDAGMRRPGSRIPIYLGESISVSEYDVNVGLVPETANNILVIGGEQEVAEAICYHSVLSASTSNEAGEATLVVVSGMRPDNELASVILPTLEALPFDHYFPATADDVEKTIAAVKETIDNRRQSNGPIPGNVYIAVFDFQNCRAFDRDTSGRIEKPSSQAALLEYVLRNGPSVGVFTILQTDNLESLGRAGSVLSAFNYRVALQMSEGDSNKVVGSSAANKLFVFNRPASRFRAYLRDNNRNLTIKFKPYKIS